MKTAIGNDHAGLQLKEHIKKIFKDLDFIDVGAYSEESTDYPDWIAKVALAVQKGDAVTGIAICGTGVGASIVANKIKGIRAALCTNSLMAEMARSHNNANVLVLGARVLGNDLAVNIIEAWLKSGFEGGRHQKRIDKISELECGRQQ